MRATLAEESWNAQEIVAAGDERLLFPSEARLRKADARDEPIAQTPAPDGVGRIAALRHVGINGLRGTAIDEPPLGGARGRAKEPDVADARSLRGGTAVRRLNDLERIPGRRRTRIRRTVRLPAAAASSTRRFTLGASPDSSQ